MAGAPDGPHPTAPRATCPHAWAAGVTSIAQSSEHDLEQLGRREQHRPCAFHHGEAVTVLSVLKGQERRAEGFRTPVAKSLVMRFETA